MSEEETKHDTIIQEDILPQENPPIATIISNDNVQDVVKEDENPHNETAEEHDNYQKQRNLSIDTTSDAAETYGDGFRSRGTSVEVKTLASPFKLSVSQLEEVGDQHKYQIKIFVIFAIQWVLAAFVILGQPFLFLVPTFECEDPRDPTNTVSCNQIEGGCSNKVLKADSPDSIVREFSLYCDQGYIVYTSSCLFFVSAAVFSIIFAQLAEIKGRKIALLLSYTMGAVSMLIATFCTEYSTIVILYSLAGSGFWSYTTITMVLLAETSSSTYLQYSTAGLLIIWATAEAAIPPLNYLFKDWRTYSFLFIAIPGIINLGFFYYVYESPRFLMLKNDFESVKKILRKIAEVNGRIFPENPAYSSASPGLNPNAAINSSKVRTFTYIDMMRFPSLRKIAFGSGFLFFVSNFCYYGTMFALPNLDGSIYWNAFFLAIAEYLAYLISLPFLSRFKRKTVIVVTLVLTVVGSLGLIIYSDPQANWYCALYELNCNDVSMKKFFAMFIKFQVSICNAVLYVYSNELFPTSVKSLGMGYVNCMTMLGSLLASANEAICMWIGVSPMASFVILIILSILTVRKMPETKGLISDEDDEIEELKDKSNLRLDLTCVKGKFEESFMRDSFMSTKLDAEIL